MADEKQLAQALELLQRHLRDVQADLQLSAADSVRLASALLSAALADGRHAGVSDATLQALDREGEALVTGAATPEPARSEATADLVAEIARAQDEDTQSEITVVVPPRVADGGVAPAEAAAPAPPAAAPSVAGSLAAAPLPADVAAMPAFDEDELAFYELPPPIDDQGPVGEVLIGLELPSEAESAAATGLRPGAVRRHRRFVSRTEVQVAVEGRGDFRPLWTRDIGSGGMFIATGEPPPLDTVLDIVLQTPDGTLQLQGRVVHVIDASAAPAGGAEPGVGVHFAGLSEGRRLLLERYIEGLTNRLKTEAAAAAAIDDDELLQCAHRFVALFDASEYYAALELTPTCSAAEVEARCDQLAQLFDRATATEPPAGCELVQRALTALGRVVKSLTVASHRLAYDYTHGHVRAEERLAACAAAGQSPDELRLVWHQVFPEKLAAAEGLVARAIAASRACDFDQACSLIGQAIEQDPLNPTLRATRSRWEVYAALVKACLDDALDAVAVSAWAAERGVSSEQLRSLWHALHPERCERAGELARRAMAAVWEQQIDAAIVAGSEALQHDPFNEILRNALERWMQPR